MAKRKVPKILDHYLESTDQYARARERGLELSDAHLLAEAEWCLYNAQDNEASCAYMDYNASSKAALSRYVDRLRARGIEPRHDFEL